MAEPQAEPFFVALTYLRERLRLGVLPPGSRITAVELADDLRLSTTPVREALSRLAGEGVVEDRRGQGYFVRVLSASDIADLYRMSLAQLLIALDPRRTPRALGGSPDSAISEDAVGDPVVQVEDLFRRWMSISGSRQLIRAFRGLQVQLGPVRRLEAQAIADLEAEAQALLALTDGDPGGERLARLRRFHGLRIRAAGRLAALLEAEAAGLRK